MFEALAIFVAIIMAYIAHQQHKVSEYRVKLDLYEKRFEIYRSVKDFMFQVRNSSKVEIKDAQSFSKDTQEARFLFEEDIFKYIGQVFEKAVRLHEVSKQLDTLPIGDKRNQLVDEKCDALLWFDNELSTLGDRFKKYLDLKKL